LLVVLVHAANIPDYEGADDIFRKAQRKCPRLVKVLGDSAYGWNGFVETVRRLFRFVLELVQRDRKRKGW
jgi:hypothetical protein